MCQRAYLRAGAFIFTVESCRVYRGRTGHLYDGGRSQGTVAA